MNNASWVIADPLGRGGRRDTSDAPHGGQRSEHPLEERHRLASLYRPNAGHPGC